MGRSAVNSEPEAHLKWMMSWCLLFLFFSGNAQQVQWAKVYPLATADYISCVTRDDNYIYAGGRTYRNATLSDYYRAMLIKMDLNGDTLFVKDIGIHGTIKSMTIDPYGMLRLNVEQYFFGPPSAYMNFLIQMTPNGFPIKIDTIPRYKLNACTMGKDSSLVVVGSKRRLGGTVNETSMYFWRMNKYGVLDPWIELNPGHPNCVANRVEQLPNGHYLVSGYVGSRIASYELDELGLTYTFKQWYQTSDFSNMNSGYVGRVGEKNWYLGGDGGPCLVANYDSLSNKKWMHKQVGILFPPQGMTDGNVVYGFSKNVFPFNVFYKRQVDSSTSWYMSVNDSLLARGIIGNILVSDYTYFEDQSAIIAGTIYQGSSVNQRDPFFMKVANVGTPVTSLLKPKRGPLKNETLAPWPNPTGGTLYLKQHFDQAAVHVYNMAGKEVGSYQMRFGQPINISGFETGVYLYRAVIDGKAYSGKIIKQ